MRAIRVHEPGDPDVLQLENVPDPAPGPGQVVVKLAAIGVNPVETYIRSGRYPMPASLPYTPGTDGAGTIAAVGQGVRSPKVGDRVYVIKSLTGTYAEYAVCDKNSVFPLPANVSFEQGTALGVPYATAYRAMFQRGGAVPGETVFIHGASGGVGTAAIQWARSRGITVAGSAGSREGEEFIRQVGAEYTLNHSEEGYMSDALGVTCGRGFDLILEMAANINLGADLEVLAPGGRVVVVGNRGTVEVNPRELMSREAAIFGVTLMKATPTELASIHAAIGAGLVNGSLRPLVDRGFPLAEAAQAHTAIMESGSRGKIVLTP